MLDVQPDAYFSYVRREIEPLLPAHAARVLEIGCGAGSTLAWLKQRWPDATTTGVDGSDSVRTMLAANADVAVIHDLEVPLPDLGSFDLILALDVLEHLRDPAGVLASLVARLAPGGSVIVSVPNVANYSVVLPLLFRRRFDYVDAGILDRTHLRFFTESSALGLMHMAGLGVVDGVITGFQGRRNRTLDRASLGLFRHHFAMQYIMRGERGADARFQWRRY